MLPRTDKLGVDLGFQEAVVPTERIIRLFQQFPIQFLSELPPNRLDSIKQVSDEFYSILQQIQNFDSKTDNPHAVRNQIIKSLTEKYQPYFDILAGLIAYGASRLRDFGSLEREARAATQAAKDRTDELTKSLESMRDEASDILDQVRNAAAEQGVSQQAIYFANESKDHEEQVKKWQRYTVLLSLVLGLYSVASIFLHKIPGISPTSTYETIQLGVSVRPRGYRVI